MQGPRAVPIADLVLAPQGDLAAELAAQRESVETELSRRQQEWEAEEARRRLRVA